MCPYSELFWSTFFPHFPAFGLNTERYGISLPVFNPNAGKYEKNADQNDSEYEHFESLRIQSECGKFADQNSSEYGHFLHSESAWCFPLLMHIKKGRKKQVSDWKEKTLFWQNIMMWMVCILRQINIFLEFLLMVKLMFNSDDSVTLLKVERQRHQMG